MILFGKVTKLNYEHKAGVITDQRGQEYFFYWYECEGEMLPPLYSTVTFLRDPNYPHTRIAELIKVDSYPTSYEERIMSQIRE